MLQSETLFPNKVQCRVTSTYPVLWPLGEKEQTLGCRRDGLCGCVGGRTGKKEEFGDRDESPAGRVSLEALLGAEQMCV